MPIAVYGCEPSGTITFYNQAAVDMWGRTPAIGDSHQKFCGSYKLYRPDGSPLPHRQCPMAKTLRDKKPAIDCEVVIQKPSGSKATAVVNTMPLINGDGELEGAINCMVDITERKRIAQDLRESEERFRRLAEAATQGVLIHEKRSIRDCNSACEKMFGYPRSDLLDSDCLRFVAPEDRMAVAKRIEEETEEPYEFIGIRQNGSKFPAIAAAKNCIFQGSNARVVVFTDLTERKQIEQTLRDLPVRLVTAEELERRRVARELHDSVTQLLSSVRFRIQLVATAISNNATKAKREIACAEKVLTEALEEVRRISRNLRPCELDDLGLAPALRSLFGEFKARTKIEMKAHLGRSKLPSHVELAVYRIVQEALNNIEKHASARRVAVRLKAEKDAVRLQISDDGIGFNFNLADGSEAENEGIGLRSMRERAELIGGSISIRSTSGRGTQIEARIPVRTQSASSAT